MSIPTVSRRTFAAGISTGLATVSIPRTPARGAEFNWKWGFDVGAEHPICVRSVQAFRKIRDDTNGQVAIEAFPNSVLGSDPKMVEQLRIGALEMCAMAGTILDSIVPITSIENIGFAFPTRETAFAAMDGDLGALIRRENLAKGVVILDKIFENGYRNFLTSKAPIRSVADLQGLRLRVSPGRLRLDTFRSLGCSPTTIVSTDLYAALQTHIVDGMESAVGDIESLRSYEVTKYLSLSRHMWSGYWNLVSLDKWNSLPRRAQEILRGRMNEAAILQRRDNELRDGSIRDLLHRQGLIINEPDRASFKAKLVAEGYYDRWRGELGDAAWSALEKYAGKLRS